MRTRRCPSTFAFQRRCLPLLPLGCLLTNPPCVSAQGFQAVCESIRDCVRCQAWGTGNKKANCSMCHLQIQMVEELKKGTRRGREGCRHMWCVSHGHVCVCMWGCMCSMPCVCACGAAPQAFPGPDDFAIMSSLCLQRRPVSTAPSRTRMMTAPTTTPWRETPLSSPTPLSVCRRKKVSMDLAGGDGPSWGLDQQ